MRIPSSSMSITAPVGQRATASHPQFGTVSLESDGRVDDSFVARPGTETREWLGLAHPGVRQFMQVAADELKESLPLGQQLEKYNVEADFSIKQAVRDHSQPRLDQVLSGSQLPGFSYLDIGKHGAVSEVSLHLPLAYSQQVEVTQQAARIRSTRYDGEHVIEAPIKDGKVDFEQAFERLELKTPWLSSSSLSDLPKEAIRSLEDPRLERLAEAAESGLLMNPEELGKGWRVEMKDGHQLLTQGAERIDLDPRDHSFTISSSSWHTGHAGSSGTSSDYKVTDAVRWREGRMTRVELA